MRSLTPQAVSMQSHLASLAREGPKMEAGRWLPAHLALLVHLQTQRGQLSSLLALQSVRVNNTSRLSFYSMQYGKHLSVYTAPYPIRLRSAVTLLRGSQLLHVKMY